MLTLMIFLILKYLCIRLKVFKKDKNEIQKLNTFLLLIQYYHL